MTNCTETDRFEFGVDLYLPVAKKEIGYFVVEEKKIEREPRIYATYSSSFADQWDSSERGKSLERLYGQLPVVIIDKGWGTGCVDLL